jgi:hypothetical protein
MAARYGRISAFLLPLLGVIVGVIIASVRPSTLVASGADRLGESVLVTGPVLVRYDESTKSALPLDAVYLLDYKRGRLLATIPALRQSVSSIQVIDGFLERDLVADFKIDLDAGPKPHFMMTTGSLGPFSLGWAPLFVFETTTSQVGVYRIQVQQTVSPTMRPHFDLIELRSYAKTALPVPIPRR